MNLESASPGGLLSRMVQRMRGGAGHAAPAAADDPGNKQALQALLARKRRNDAIRQQEFAHLRALRQCAAQGAPAQDSHPAASSDFPTSSAGQDARVAQTLEKIDAIEAQMSRQWWRGKPEAPHALNSLLSVPPSDLSRVPTLGEDRIYRPLEAAVVPALPLLMPLAADPAPALAPTGLPGGHGPDLEEAAILFAHGDLQAAKARLLEVLVQALDQQPADGGATDAGTDVLWHALLDLHRATGDAESFDALAIDYATHFGRSAPLWFSMPQQLGLVPLCAPVPVSAAARGLRWVAPALMTVGAVAALDSALATARTQHAQPPWVLSWRRLLEVDEAALPRLTAMLGQWAEQPDPLVWTEVEGWLHRLAERTPVGDTTRPAAWWLLRLAVLRCLGQEALFEQVALDYCITYEVSPPAWSPPLQACAVQEEGEPSGLSAQPLEGGAAAPVRAAQDGQADPHLRQDRGLAGVVEGDPAHWLQALTARARLGEPLDIACDQLIRMDFVAAGSVLNWAADMQAQGHQLHFTQLHQLVAVFFRVIGIHEHAKVLARQA